MSVGIISINNLLFIFLTKLFQGEFIPLNQIINLSINQLINEQVKKQ